MKMWNKFRNTSGFSLTEVMIGILILTVAIVSASNLLVSLVKTNKLNVQTLQAYYLAQEGLEAVRNIRDTNWLHNLDFKGEGGAEKGVYEAFEVGGSYAVFLESEGWRNSRPDEGLSLLDLRNLRPWGFSEFFISDPISDPFNDVFAVVKDDFNGKTYYSSGSPDESGFYRHIEILDACGNDPALLEEDCEDFILVRSVVNWKDGSRDREVAVEEVLSNWKGGAL